MILLGNGRLITRDGANTFIEDGAVLLDGPVIAAVGETGTLRAAHPDAVFEDARGGVIMPGFINAHNHIYSAFARGMHIAGPSPSNFLEILSKLWWTLDRNLMLPDTRASADAALIDAIENGTTTMFDHHASYGEIPGSLFAIAERARALGVRVSLCYEASDRGGPDKFREAVKENADFIAYARSDDSGMIAGMMGMHAPFTLSDASITACAEATPSGAGFHIHVAEGLDDVLINLKAHGMRPVNRLFSLNILGPDTLCGHATHVSEAEMELLAETGSRVVHNPESNMGNAVGCPPVMRMLDRGIQVGLGTDGYTGDMLESYKVANLLHKHHLNDPQAAWREVPEMLFTHNAALASRAFGREIGALKPGAAADVIVLEYEAPTPLQAHNIDGHVLFGMSGRCVTTTVIDGVVRMRNRELVGIDKARVMAHCREQAKSLWSRIHVE